MLQKRCVCVGGGLQTQTDEGKVQSWFIMLQSYVQSLDPDNVGKQIGLGHRQSNSPKIFPKGTYKIEASA